MATFYFINLIVAAETIEGGKLFAEIWYVLTLCDEVSMPLQEVNEVQVK